MMVGDNFQMIVVIAMRNLVLNPPSLTSYPDDQKADVYSGWKPWQYSRQFENIRIIIVEWGGWGSLGRIYVIMPVLVVGWGVTVTTCGMWAGRTELRSWRDKATQGRTHRDKNYSISILQKCKIPTFWSCDSCPLPCLYFHSLSTCQPHQAHFSPCLILRFKHFWLSSIQGLM